MTKILQMLISRNRISQIVLFGCALALAVLATAALPEQANAQASATFTSSKILCLGSPNTTNPSNCQPAQIVASGVPVFYVITVTNPSGQPAQTITLDETSPGFPSGFNPGAVSCTDQAGGTVGVTVAGHVYGFNLPPAVTLPSWTVICTISGTFSSSANGTTQQNSVAVSNGHGGMTMTDTVNTFVAATTPLNADLSVTKSASPTSIGVGTSYPLPATVSYTITIKNNGPAAVDVGHWFVLHDTLALLPSSVALQATFVSATCLPVGSTPASTCLDGPQTSHSGLVPTAAPQSLLDWGYAPGNLGHFAPGDAITVTITVKISTISGLSCVKALNSDGLNNRTFFTLTNLTDQTAVSEINPANDTSLLVPVSVKTGNVIVNPNCGDGQLTVTKTQVSPLPPTSPVSWGATVTYDITIKNTSIPPQAITINAGDLKDYVVEGAGTPPFKRTFISATCFTSTPLSICSGFIPGSPPPFNYTYYGQSNLGWSSGNQLALLNPNDSVTIRVAFQYSDPDCETVPNTNPKPIFNVASVTYMATPVGGSAPQVQFTQYATAQTNMQPQPTCKFVVTKQLGSPSQNVQFGVPLVYKVSFTNNGAARNVGTVMDSVRITNPAYATQVPFTSVGGTCSWVGNSASPPSFPGGSGTAIYTNSPSQGAPIFQFTNLYFPQNSTLICLVTITVQRPAFNNPNCSTLPAYFENLGLMDVTNPYNPNVTWPPSGTYVAGALSNPSPQNTNWATIDSQLPKCYNVLINKTASVNNLTPAWTYAPSGPPVQYSITVTNTGTSGTLTGGVPPLTSPGWNGLRVQDVIPSPGGYNYGPNIVGLGPTCAPQCAPLRPPLPSPSPSFAGVSNLAFGSQFVWNLTLQPPFVAGQTINNCADVTPQGTFTGPDWYPNYDPSIAPTNPPKACAHVPVLTTTDLRVSKTIVNAAGHTLNIPLTAFGVQVACQTYPLLSSGNLTLTVGAPTGLPNGGSVSSLMGFIHNVPVAPGETCTVTEPTLPAVPLGACGKETAAYWDTTFSPAQTIPISAAGPNAVTVTNTLRCKPTLSVTKTFVDATGSLVPIQPPTFNINVTCNPIAIAPTNLALTPPATATSSSSPQGQGIVHNVPVGPGETCTVTEPVLPAIPAVAQHICGGAAYWDSSPAYSPSQTIPISATGPNAVTVTNTLRCKAPPQVKLDVIKDIVDMTPGGANHPASPYLVTLGCNPASAPGNVSLTAGTPVSVAVSLGANCTPNEVPPPVPAAAIQACATAGVPAPAHWETPAFVPPSFTVTSAGPQIVHVINVLRCGIQDSPGTITVLKRVSGPSGIVPPPTAFSISVKCGTQPATPMPLSANGSQTVVAFPPTCTVSETPPVPLSFVASSCPTGMATWLPPTYAPSSSVTVPYGAAAAVVVTNNYQCLPAHPPPPQGAAACSPPMVPGAVPGQCVCPRGTVAHGQDCVKPIVCSPPMVLNAAGTACACPEGTVQRGRACVKPIECRPPMVLNATGTACACPEGTVQRGRACVKPIECRPPMIANPAGTACVCPPGLQQKGRECVKPIECHPPMIANPAGTACVCPPGLQQKGRECVGPDRPDPRGKR